MIETTGHIVVYVGSTVESAERLLIIATLKATGGSKVKAARTLGVSLKTLYNRLNLYREQGVYP